MRRNGIKSIVLISSAILILGGCTASQQGSQEPNSGLSKTQIGAIAGAVLGATVGGVTDTERTSRSRRVLIGAGAGAAIGAAIGYSLDKQAQEVAQVLNNKW